MNNKFSVLFLCILFATIPLSSEAAKLTKAQMEELYNTGGSVSTRPSVRETNIVNTKPPATEKPKVETRESSKPILKTNISTPKQKAASTIKTEAQASKYSQEKTPAINKNSIANSKTATSKQKSKTVKVKNEKPQKSQKETNANASSWRIKVAQKNLRILGFSKEASTGKLTATTKEALLSFQKKYNLQASGDLNNQTYAKLNWEAFAKTGIKNIKGSDIVAQAAKYKGVPYVFGGTTPKGFDCSGYIQYVFKQLGGVLTRTADTQAEEGIFVTQKQLKPGDLVFFTTYEPGASHAGIYAGNGKFWNASSSRGVVLCELSDDYWRTRYYGARRVLVSNGEIK